MVFEVPSTESGAPGMLRGLESEAIDGARRRREGLRAESSGGRDMAPTSSTGRKGSCKTCRAGHSRQSCKRNAVPNDEATGK